MLIRVGDDTTSETGNNINVFAADPQLTAPIVVEYEEECKSGSARAPKSITWMRIAIKTGKVRASIPSLEVHYTSTTSKLGVDANVRLQRLTFEGVGQGRWRGSIDLRTSFLRLIWASGKVGGKAASICARHF